MAQYLLRQVRLLDPAAGTDKVTDVWLQEGTIAGLGKKLPPVAGATEIQGEGRCILGPGLVDLYCHSGEPGYEDRETLISLAESAIAGGFCRLGVLPNTEPAMDQAGQVVWLQQQWQQVRRHCPQLPRLECWGAITQDRQGERLTPIGDLVRSGIRGFTDGRAIANLNLLDRFLDYLQPQPLPVALMAQDAQLKGKATAWDGPEALRFGLPGMSVATESAALAALLELIADRPFPVHIMRLSTARGVALIRQAQVQGLPVTASTPWLHLLLDSNALRDYPPHLKLDPPLPNPADRQALRQGVQDGVISAIASDHRAYTYEEKTVSFGEAPAGCLGLPLVLSLLWQVLVMEEKWSPLTLWQALSTGPSHCWGETPQALAVGQTVALTLFDPAIVWTVDSDTIPSPYPQNPWWGKTLTGKVTQVFLP